VGTAARRGPGRLTCTGLFSPVHFTAPEGITFEVPPDARIIKGADKEVVGQVAANIRKIRKPDPTR